MTASATTVPTPKTPARSPIAPRGDLSAGARPSPPPWRVALQRGDRRRALSPRRRATGSATGEETRRAAAAERHRGGVRDLPDHLQPDRRAQQTAAPHRRADRSRAGDLGRAPRAARAPRLQRSPRSSSSGSAGRTGCVERRRRPAGIAGGGESFADLLERVRRTQERDFVADGVDRTLLVGHGIFFRFTFAHTVLGEAFTPAMIDRLWRIGSLNCGLSTFQHTARGDSPNPADIDGWRCVTLDGPDRRCGRRHRHRRRRGRQLSRLSRRSPDRRSGQPRRRAPRGGPPGSRPTRERGRRGRP